jgi:hypothetical protein
MLKAQQQREKWVEVVEEYERSRLTQAEFVTRREVALSTLQSWLRRWRAQRTGPVRLLPVAVAPTQPPTKSLVATCVANEVNPEAYLADVLTRVQSHPNSRLDELLPVAWKRLRAVDTS